MNAFPEDIQFQRSWRSYQQRVLSELEGYLDDDHLHVIAAPGSGKTVLGLEVVRRLNRPTLILSPTLAVRDQWVDRLLGLFTDRRRGIPDWISKDIKRPRLLTVSTYQGLHSAYTGTPAEPPPAQSARKGATSRAAGRKTLFEALRRQGVRAIVLDEAHHLRSEWWRCLTDLKKHLVHPTVVALTATAPFDVSPFEWDRYIGLCGPIDAEISVPELVREQNLCPHQDYVSVSCPLRSEQAEIRAFRQDAEIFVNELRANTDFIQALREQTCVKRPKDHVEEILADPAFYSSVAFFLKHVTRRAPRRLLRIIGLSPRKCPPFDLGWLETLLTGCLYTHARAFEGHKPLFQQILRDAKRIGAAEGRRINLRSTGKIAKLLVRSASKLKSIETIVKIEHDALGPDLRLVVLTDFVRRADFPKDEADAKPLKRLGVVPIFEHLRRCDLASTRLGILSGTLTVVPSESQERLQVIARQMNIAPTAIALKPLAHDKRFCEVTVGGADKHKTVGLITRLFTEGRITVLVGTKSLLGEGWDAPSVNALILASFVGSYMLSNQMRGRAIRTQDGNPSKTANIWHLVCQEAQRAEFGEDMETLARRFKSFVGVSFTTRRIESGLARLGLGKPPFDQARIEHINTVMQQKAHDRHRLETEWQQALASAGGGGMVEQVAASQLTLPRNFVFKRTILALLWQGWFWGVSGFALVMRSIEGNADKTTLKRLLLLVAVASAFGAALALPKCLKAAWLFIRHAPVASSMKQIGKALIKALARTDLMETPLSRLKVAAQRQDYGFVSCSLKGGTTRERSIFLDALQELLGAIENPRYLLVRKSPLGWLMRKDYHAVPKAVGKNKDLATAFATMWSRYVGPAKLIYTRSPSGRRWLLKARAHSMASAFQRRAERVRSWQ